MSKLTPAQEAKLAEVRAADKRYRKEKRDAHRRHRLLAEEEIHESKIARDILTAQAAALGVPTAIIGRDGLSTTDYYTARDAIESGQAVLGGGEEVEEEAPAFVETAVEQFTANPLTLVDDGLVSVELDALDFAPFGIESDGGVHTFTVSEDGVVQPVGGENDETWTHPVVQVVMGQDDSWRRRIVEFARKEGEE